MSIRQLPEDVVGKLKSSTVIVSLNGAAIGLVSNALDAEAAKINITVDYARGNCTVEDNGCGIPRERLDKIFTNLRNLSIALLNTMALF